MNSSPLSTMLGVISGALRRLLRDRSGNAIMLAAAAIVPLLAIIGSGIDMGRSYLSESRLQRACDAGVLAARKKLGSAVVLDGMVPAAVATNGNKFFNINFRDGVYGTQNRNFTMTLEADYAISAVATVDVPTTVMRLFAFDKVPVRVICEARLNFANTDVMMVLDTTGSMNETNPGDVKPKIGVLKDVVSNFHTQLEASKGPGIRIRYGFVPYSANVNVGSLLANNWVVDNWTYQSRETTAGTPVIWDYTYYDNWVTISGSYDIQNDSSYAATYHPAVTGTESGGGSPAYYTCDTPNPANTYVGSSVQIGPTITEPYVGPPAGTKRTRHIRLTEDGKYYYQELSGTTCLIKYYDFHMLIREYDEITIPVSSPTTNYEYKPVSRSVTSWRSESNGCIEERATYEINNYSAVDLTRALDLDLDLVPTAGNPDTQWRPSYPGIIWERSRDWYGGGSFTVAPVTTGDAYFFYPANYAGLVACPTVSRKLAEMNSGDVSTYLASLTTGGVTYHDIGMIWGGRLLSSTGLFAAENADLPGKPTKRHLIFLTDGQTEASDLTYGAYGVEPLDRRRWSSASAKTLTQVVEKRFTVACDEVKKRNITVWVIGFGTTMTSLMKNCAGSGHWFQADNAAQLNTVFAKIAASMGDLRISK